jgi:hypothetical protein
MKLPTVVTKVFSIDTWGGGPPAFTSGFPVDWAWMKGTTGSETGGFTRMLGATKLRLNTTAAEVAEGDAKFDYMNGWNPQTFTLSDYYSWMFKRAPGYMDVVCYTGTGTSGTAIPHNLNVVPELIISKSRSTTGNWWVWGGSYLGGQTQGMNLDATYGAYAAWAAGSNPTSTNIYSGYNVIGASSVTYVAYLFATCPGVSKVGNYTGTGTTQTINCGFAAGARFVLIKRTDSTGDWYVWDSARGIIAGDDPYILLNSTAAEVTGTDYVDPVASGFEISSTAPAAINASGGSFIFLAIS